MHFLNSIIFIVYCLYSCLSLNRRSERQQIGFSRSTGRNVFLTILWYRFMVMHFGLMLILSFSRISERHMPNLWPRYDR